MSIDNQTEIFLIPEDSKEQFSKLLTPEACERLGERTILALGASHDGVACGAVAAFFGAGIADIISVFVAEGFRCKGVGKALIDGILTSAKRVGVSQIQVVYNEAASENLMPFLKKLGFSNEDEGIPAFKLTLETLKHMVLPEVSTDEIVSFDMISMSLLNEYNAGPGAPENGALPLFMSEIDKDISSACLTTEGELGGFVAVSRRSQGLEISNVYVDQLCTLMLIALFKCSLDAAVEIFLPETEVRVTAVNEESERLLRHIFKGLDMEESSVRTLYRAV